MAHKYILMTLVQVFDINYLYNIVVRELGNFYNLRVHVRGVLGNKCTGWHKKTWLFCSDGEGDPLHTLLEGALGHNAACQLWFHFEEEIKGCWCEICKIVKLRGHLDAFHRSQLLKTAEAMGTWAKAWQKRSSVLTCLVFYAHKPL